MDWVRIADWFILAAASAGIVWRLAWLVRTRANDHLSEEGPDGSRRESWSSIRYMLVGVASAACLLSGVERWAGLGVVIGLLVLAFGADLAGRQRRARAPQS